MPKRGSDYFRYFPGSKEVALWGLEGTACGRTQIKPKTSYPPSRHPEDHHFDWEHGRVLEALQIVLISDGRGELEWRRGRRVTIEAGAVFVLPPRVWHRYRPDRETGWTESWIEVQGPLVERIVRARKFSVETRVQQNALAGELEQTLEAVHSMAREADPGFSPTMVARAFQVLAAWSELGRGGREKSPLVRAVVAAERELEEMHTEAVNVEELARKLGVAYSHFRRAFKAHTGFAPWRYVLNLRLTRARRLLVSSELTLDEMAVRLGFSSAFHLSAAFKTAYGEAPDVWRRKMRGGGNA